MNKSPKEIGGSFIEDKRCFFNNLYFQWKGRLTPIKSNLNGGLPVGFN